MLFSSYYVYFTVLHILMICVQILWPRLITRVCQSRILIKTKNENCCYCISGVRSELNNILRCIFVAFYYIEDSCVNVGSVIKWHWSSNTGNFSFVTCGRMPLCLIHMVVDGESSNLRGKVSVQLFKVALGRADWNMSSYCVICEQLCDLQLGIVCFLWHHSFLSLYSKRNSVYTIQFNH